MVESKNQKLAEELAKLAIVKAIEKVSVSELIGYIKVADPDFTGLRTTEERIALVAEAKKILADAVDASEWIVNMTTEKLEPHNGVLKFYGAGDDKETPIMWAHFGFGPLVLPEHRADMIKEIGSIILEEM